MHSVASGRNLDHISRFGSLRVRPPDLFFTLAILAGFGLGVVRIFEGVVAVRNPDVVGIESKLLTLSEMQNTFMGSSPI